jgi:protein-S-isoprenylcysteine O-methyltransferase Ste14
VEPWDKLIIFFYGILLCALFIVAGLDAVRFEWSSVSISVKVLGWCTFLAALVLISWVLAENTYASRYVRIQKDREHQVISTGPYRFVRHPMYVGVILWVIGVPLVLGSTWALVPSVLVIALFFVRTALEDRTLQKGLPGYKEYSERVRYRLIPAVW